MNMHSSSSAPVTTEANPVRAPAATPALLSMNVVFDEADMKPPSIAAKPSMPRTVLIRGSRPCRQHPRVARHTDRRADVVEQV